MRSALIRRLKAGVLKKQKIVTTLCQNPKVPWEKVEKALNIWHRAKKELEFILGEDEDA